MSNFVIACDIDEVVFPYLSAWVQYYNRTHNTNIKISDFHSYNFSHVLRDHDEEYITTLIYDFHEASEFLEVKPIEGAVNAIMQLQQIGDVHFVTSRQLAIGELTCRWMKRYFGIDEEKIHIGNHFCKDTDDITAKRSKSDMCRSINAQVLIDDSVAYAQECAASGIHAILFDLDGLYGWNKLDDTGPTLHKNATRVTSWEELISTVRAVKSMHI